MKLYSASVLFWRVDSSLDYPVVATDKVYSSLESFVDFCELAARENPWFLRSSVSVNAMESLLHDDGTVTPQRTIYRKLH
jgi:hypothetical protein